MTVSHEDRIFAIVVGSASFVALLFSLAIFSTKSWAVGGKLAMFAVVVLIWAIVCGVVTIFYFEERDKRAQDERERVAKEEEARLKRKRLEARA